MKIRLKFQKYDFYFLIIILSIYQNDEDREINENMILIVTKKKEVNFGSTWPRVRRMTITKANYLRLKFQTLKPHSHSFEMDDVRNGCVRGDRTTDCAEGTDSCI